MGITIDAQPGARVRGGDALARLHVRAKEDAPRVADRVLRAFSLGPAREMPPPLGRGRVPA